MPGITEKVMIAAIIATAVTFIAGTYMDHAYKDCPKEQTK